MKQSVILDGFSYDVQIVDKSTGQIKDTIVGCNLIPAAGLTFLIQSPFGGATAINSFFVGLFDNDYVPTAGVVSTDLPSVVGEFTGYSETTRPTWSRVFNGTSAQDNAAARAVFTPTVARRIYGCFIVSAADKGGNTGLLLSVLRFPSPRDVTVGEELRVLAGLTYVAANAF